MFRNILRKTLASLAGLSMLMGVGVKVEKPVNSIGVVQEHSLPKISLKMNQANARDYNLEGRLAVLGFDMIFNGLKCGIGASHRGDDFWPAFGKCAVAGAIVYGGKEIASWNGYVPFAGGMGKIFHDLGVSMSDNIAFGRGIMDRFVTDFGPLEFEFDAKKGFDMYVHPYPIYAISANFAKGYKFDWKETLYNLTPVFVMDPVYKANGSIVYGYTQQNVFVYCKALGKDHERISKSHEMNHVLFLSEYRFIDGLMYDKGGLIVGALSLLPDPLSPLFQGNDDLKFIINHIKFGPWLAERLMQLPLRINYKTYHFIPPELEAYTMERPITPNFHPFYDHRD